MREVLHQLTLALALPIAVSAVWIARGEPGGAQRFESAAAYRAQLAPLPWPTQSRLRAPREALDWRRAPAEAELPLPPRRRALLPAPAQPLELAASAETAVSPIAAAPLRAALMTSGPAVAEMRPAPLAPLPFVATLPGLASSSASGPARVAASAARTGAARSGAASPAAQPTAAPALRTVASAAAAASAKPSAPSASVGAGSAPATAKPAVAATPLAPAPVKPAPTPSAKPAAAAPVRVAASDAPKRSTPSSPLVSSPLTAPNLHQDGSPAAKSRERAGLTPLENGWRERAKASAPSPALAQALHGIEPTLDLLLGKAKDARSPFEQPMPTLPATAQPPELAAAPAPTPAAARAPVPDRFGFVLPVLETLAAQHRDLTSAGDGLAFASEPVYAPAMRVSAIPEPASAWLVGAGLAAVAALRRRDARG